MTLVDLMYTSSLTPGLVVVDEFYSDGAALRPKTVRTIESIEEIVEGLYRITFADGSVTRAQGDERWMRA